MAIINRYEEKDDVYVVPEYIVFLRLRLTNLSHQSVYITEFRINGIKIYEELYTSQKYDNVRAYTVFDPNKPETIKKLYSGENVVNSSSENLNINEDQLLKPIIKLEAKEVREGILSFILHSEKNYELIEDGWNELTIKTTDKEYNVLVEIRKTLSKSKLNEFNKNK
ncbi:hypothetical protein [Staphylococcus epidermidis]|uniref:hypothetical protein n=1 Tax=Staphylococcus epidermidis TaxID=1282 RepID=UPI000A8D3BF2|nr:hypothetical protein [Staphylococcus epidermidis]MCG2381923.1 hypothetical protein [Staphylococcus epidermidis]